MPEAKFNDRKMLKMIDEGLSQAEAARRLGVTRQAVSHRLQELRGRTTRVVVAKQKKIQKLVDQKIDAIQQLLEINHQANKMLDEAEEDPELRLKIMGEIRGQLRLQLEIFKTLYDVQAVEEFMDETLDVIGRVAPEVRNEIINRLNQRKSVRTALRWS
jgi:predicted transcriptional regulator